MLRNLLGASGAAVMVFCLSGPVLALDAADISLLLKNGVEEAVVINLAREQGLSRPLTAQEVLQLNAGGASSRLLEFLTDSAQVRAAAPQVMAPQMVAPQAAAVPMAAPPTVYYPSSPEVCPVYVYPTPTYQVIRPRPRFYYGLNMSFGDRHGHRRHGGPGRHRR